jgi:hypothetical protein
MLKRNPNQVMLDDEEQDELDELVKLERLDQRDIRIGAGTVLRELGMPRVRTRLAELRAKIIMATPTTDRREGERRDGERRVASAK